ncbi:MAG: hypothetical protein AB7R55_00375 [Gemmatimonadales bacterium]
MTTPCLVLTMLTLAVPGLSAQQPKATLAKRLKGAVTTAIDTAAAQTAAAVVDSALGTGALRLSAGECPVGTTAAGSATVGTAAVGQVKKALGGAERPSTAGAPAPTCVPDSSLAGQQAMVAAMQAQAAAQAASGGQVVPGTTPGAASAIGAVAAVTPVGLAVGAAPVAAKGVKALGGLFGKGQTAESMIEDLSEGRLELKAVRFVGASDALKHDVTESFAFLAEALQSLDGEFVLNLPPESNGKSPPDTAMARRRLTKLSAHLAMAGIEGRLELRSEPPGLDPERKLPKLGDARVEILAKPAPEQER